MINNFHYSISVPRSRIIIIINGSDVKKDLSLPSVLPLVIDLCATLFPYNMFSFAIYNMLSFSLNMPHNCAKNIWIWKTIEKLMCSARSLTKSEIAKIMLCVLLYWPIEMSAWFACNTHWYIYFLYLEFILPTAMLDAPVAPRPQLDPRPSTFGKWMRCWTMRCRPKQALEQEHGKGKTSWETRMWIEYDIQHYDVYEKEMNINYYD